MEMQIVLNLYSLIVCEYNGGEVLQAYEMIQLNSDPMNEYIVYKILCINILNIYIYIYIYE